MTIDEIVTYGTDLLHAAGIDSARLDTFLLLEHIIGTDKGSLLAHLDDPITPVHEERIKKCIRRRATHEPIAYIRGYSEFYGRTFVVNQRVLIPRPETEDAIDLLKSVAKPDQNIIDIGTGSGILAITAKLELPQSHVLGVDIDNGCIAVATENADNLKANVAFKISDLLSNIAKDELNGALIIANLPYVPYNLEINDAAKHEPRSAIFADSEGLADYQNLWAQIASLTLKPRYVICESLLNQHKALEKLSKQAGYILQTTRGLQQLFLLSPQS